MKKIFRNLIILIAIIIIIAALCFILKDKKVVSKILNNEISDIHGTIVDQRMDYLTVSEGIISVSSNEDYYDYYTLDGKKINEEPLYDVYDFSHGYGTCAKGLHQYGVIDKEGNTVIDFVYDYVDVLSENRFLAEKEENYKLLDEKGNVILEENNVFISKIDDNLLLDENYDDKTCKFIDYDGNVINTFASIPSIYYGSEGMILFGEKDLWGFMDVTGKVVIEPKYTNASSFVNGYALVEEQDSTIKFIDKEGKDFCVIPEEYSYYVSNVNENGLIICENKDGKQGVINTEGNVVVNFEYDHIEDFAEGLAVVSKDDKYGYIDSNGNIAFELGYDMCEPFENGVACVNKDDAWTLIDKNGRSVDNKKYMYGDMTQAESGYVFVTNDYNYVGLLNISTGKLEYGDLSFDEELNDDPNYYYYGEKSGHYRYDFYENGVEE